MKTRIKSLSFTISDNSTLYHRGTAIRATIQSNGERKDTSDNEKDSN